MANGTRFQPGSRWTSRNGRHAGAGVVTDHVTGTSVFVVYQGGCENWGNQKTDQSRINRIDHAEFEARYVPSSSVGSNHKTAGRAFRRSKVAVQMPLDSTDPVVLVPPK